MWPQHSDKYVIYVTTIIDKNNSLHMTPTLQNIIVIQPATLLNTNSYLKIAYNIGT